jgi:uncharacterized protein YjdB
MRKSYFLFLVVALFLVVTANAQRDEWTWPLSKYSIWNMPIGSNAVFVDAKIAVPDQYAGDQAYFDRNVYVNPDAGDSENKVVTWFESDKENYNSTQGGYQWQGGTEHYPGMNAAEQRGKLQNIYGYGIEGAHWGAGLSGFGGNFRMGELINDVPIKHALGIEVSGWKEVYYDGNDQSWNTSNGDYTAYGYRWPADRNDSYAAGNYNGDVSAVRMGCLFALSPSVNIDNIGLTTKAGKKIAWTLQNYGAYLIDDSYGQNSGSSIINFAYQKGVNEEFNSTYGHNFDLHWDGGSPRQLPFFKDLDKIVVLLAVINNNGPHSIGGGGNPRQCLAPAFANGHADGVSSNPNGSVVEPGGCNGSSVTVTGVTLSPTTANVTIGSTATLTATVTPTNASNKSVNWTTSNSAIATVSGGVVSGVAAGTVTITVTTVDAGKTATATITVTSDGTSKFTGTNIGTAGSYNNDATLTFDKALDGNLSTYFDAAVADGAWAGLDLGSAKKVTKVRYAPRSGWAARMNGGKIQGANAADFFGAVDLLTITAVPVEGSLTTASVSNTTAYRYYRYLSPTGSYGNIAEIEFWGTTTVAVTGVSVSPTSATVAVGATTTLSATVAPSNATNKSVNWNSSATGVATVNASGVVTGVAAGSATITVTTADGGKTATCAVTVTPAGSSAKLTGTIIGTAGSWNSDANVTKEKAMDGSLSTFFDGPVSDGVWVGLDLGSAKTISSAKYCPRTSWATRMTGGKIQGSNVADFSTATDLFTISGTPTENVLTTATISNSTAFRYVRYLAPNGGYGNIAEVEFWGAAGTTVAVTGVTLAPTTATVAIGATTTLTATVAPTNATNKTVSYASSNTAIATVSSTGLITAVAAGTATITVTTADGSKTATCAITVTAATVTNLLSTNASFESETGISYANGAWTGITGWDAFNTGYNHIGVIAGAAYDGNNKLEFQFGGWAETKAANRAGVTSGSVYNCSFALSKTAVASTGANSPVTVEIKWFNSAGTLLSSSSSGNLLNNTVTSPWAVFNFNATAPANAVKAGVLITQIRPAYPNDNLATVVADKFRLTAGAGLKSAIALSVNEISIGSFSMYPNPVVGNTVTLKFAKTIDNGQVSVYNLSGVCVFKEYFNSNSFEMNINGLKKGVYSIKVTTGNNSMVEKLIVR